MVSASLREARPTLVISMNFSRRASSFWMKLPVMPRGAEKFNEQRRASSRHQHSKNTATQRQAQAPRVLVLCLTHGPSMPFSRYTRLSGSPYWRTFRSPARPPHPTWCVKRGWRSLRKRSLGAFCLAVGGQKRGEDSWLPVVACRPSSH